MLATTLNMHECRNTQYSVQNKNKCPISSYSVHHSERLFSASPITFRLYTVGTEVWGDRGATFLKTVFAKSLLAISPDPLTSSPDLD